MEEEKSSKEFLDEVEQEGGKAFEENQEEKDTPAESSTEDKPTEESPSSQGEEDKKEEVEAPKESNTEMEEKPPPFHEHPRWKRMYDENQTLKQDISDIKDNAGKDKLQREEQEQNQTIPGWFSNQYGDDPKIWREYKSYEVAHDERLIQKIQSDQETVVQKKQQESDKWTSWVETEVQGLVDEGLKFDRNELMKTVADYKPTDEQGNLDFRKGYEIMTKLKSVEVAKKAVKTQEKKEVASQTMDEGKGESEKKNFLTHAELTNMGWTDL